MGEWKSLIFVPENYDSLKGYPVIVALHGYGGSPYDFTRDLAKFLREKGYIFVCPFGTEVHGLRSFAWGSIDSCEVKYPINQRHLRFLLKLWNDAEIMWYAGFAKNWQALGKPKGYGMVIIYIFYTILIGVPIKPNTERSSFSITLRACTVSKWLDLILNVGGSVPS